MAADLQPDNADHARAAEDHPHGARWPALPRLRRRHHARRVPVISGTAGTDCGAACLAMILGYHGKHVPMEEVRQAVGVSRDGANAFNILSAAAHHGLRGRGVRLLPDALTTIPAPAILHWTGNHFVVFVAAQRAGVDLVDPRCGRRRVSWEQFYSAFSGVALLLEPTAALIPEGPRRGHLLRHLHPLLSQSAHLARLLGTSALLQVLALAVPLLTSALVDRIVPRGDWRLLQLLALSLTVLCGFHFLASLLRARLLLDLRTRLDARMTLGFCQHLASLPYRFFQLRAAGDLMLRLNSNSTVRELLTAGALSSLIDGALVVLYLVLLLLASPLLGALAAGLGVLQALVFVAARRRQRDLLARNLESQARASSYEVELLTGMETLKALGSEQRAVEHWWGLFSAVLNINRERGRLDALLDSLTSTLRLASPLLLLLCGAQQVLRGEMSLGTMLGLAALGGGFLLPLAQLVTTLGQLQLLRSYTERLDDVLDTPPEQDAAEVRPAPPLRGHVAVEALSFRYGPLSEPVLRDVSLEIQPGQLVALVGTSGSGKSTLASLLAGLHVPSSGCVRYDGADLRGLELRSLRRQLGVVTQQTHLFGRSLRSNIALADPDAPLEAVMEAARLAQIHDEIMAMPMRYETLLLDRGASLSGGQRQRLALARALLLRPALLILDEATSALDSETERRVQQALEGLECTRVVIAHRLSSVVKADQILVLQGGRVVERGAHAELLARGGAYAALVAAQATQ